MKILMQNRVDLFDKPGGDLVQMQKTKAALKALGHFVEISTDLHPNLTGYDIVHLYNITRIHETLAQLVWAKKFGTPVVISPIYHKMSEIERYERLGRTGLLKKMNTLLRTTEQRETLKNVVRLRDARQRSALIKTLQRGFGAAQKQVLSEVDGWVVLAEAERRAIETDFGVKNRSTVAPNAVDRQFFSAKPDEFVKRYGLKGFVLCVSRIEDRKNQIRLIEAMEGFGKMLVFIGGENPNHAAYVAEFKKRVEQNKDWVVYLGPLPYAQLPSAYVAAQVHVLPSWFEVVSLTAMEAAAAGCACVVAETGYMNEYFGDEVDYCDPGNTHSISLAIEQALKRTMSDCLIKRMERFTWQETAKSTQVAYERAM